MIFLTAAPIPATDENLEAIRAGVFNKLDELIEMMWETVSSSATISLTDGVDLATGIEYKNVVTVANVHFERDGKRFVGNGTIMIDIDSVKTELDTFVEKYSS